MSLSHNRAIQYPQNPLTFIQVSIAARSQRPLIRILGGAHHCRRRGGRIFRGGASIASGRHLLWNRWAVLSGIASAVNLGAALWILKGARIHRSITLEADAKHLLADVWTSIGALAGFVMVAMTGLASLDSIVALIEPNDDPGSFTGANEP